MSKHPPGISPLEASEAKWLVSVLQSAGATILQADEAGHIHYTVAGIAYSLAAGKPQGPLEDLNPKTQDRVSS